MEEISKEPDKIKSDNGPNGSGRESTPNNLYTVSLQERLEILLKKRILIPKVIDTFTESHKDFDYNQITKFSRFNGEIVTDIYTKDEDLIIYERLGTGMIVNAKPELEKNLQKSLAEFGKMNLQLNRREQKRFGIRISNAYRLALHGRTEEPIEMIKSVNAKVLQLRKNNFRLIYLLGAFLVTLILAMVGVYNVQENPNWQLTNVYRILIFSSIGGFFSVLLGYKSIITDLPEEGLRSYFWNGVSRILISMLAGVVGYELVLGGFLFSNFKDNPNALNCILIIAGFTETFIPGILKKTSKEVKRDTD